LPPAPPDDVCCRRQKNCDESRRIERAARTELLAFLLHQPAARAQVIVEVLVPPHPKQLRVRRIPERLHLLPDRVVEAEGSTSLLVLDGLEVLAVAVVVGGDRVHLIVAVAALLLLLGH
jgi:hypothetical protein